MRSRNHNRPSFGGRAQSVGKIPRGEPEGIVLCPRPTAEVVGNRGSLDDCDAADACAAVFSDGFSFR